MQTFSKLLHKWIQSVIWLKSRAVAIYFPNASFFQAYLWLNCSAWTVFSLDAQFSTASDRQASEEKKCLNIWEILSTNKPEKWKTIYNIFLLQWRQKGNSLVLGGQKEKAEQLDEVLRRHTKVWEKSEINSREHKSWFWLDYAKKVNWNS